MCPAVSKSQQRFMGLVHALQKGELSPDEVSPEVRKAAATMKKKDAKDFASTKHKGLPVQVIDEVAKFDGNLISLYLHGMINVAHKGNVKDARDYLEHMIKIDKEGKDFWNAVYSLLKKLYKKELGAKVNEIMLSEVDIVKDALAYAKKKYKYNSSDLKRLAKELATYMRSGDIKQVEDAIGYIDHREDDLGESIASDARSLSSRTLAGLTGITKHKEIEKIQNDFVKFAMGNKNKYKNWHDAWEGFWKKNELKEGGWADRKKMTGNLKKAYISYNRDPYYKDVFDALTAGDGSGMKKAIEALSSVRGRNAVSTVKDFIQKLGHESVLKKLGLQAEACGKVVAEEDNEVCSKELAVGTAVEKEHTSDPEEAKQIALDHIKEDPQYYSKLAKTGLIDEPEAIELTKQFGMIESQEENLRKVIREIIAEQSVVEKAKQIISNIFKRNKGKIGSSEYKDIFSKGFLKTHGDMAVKYAWSDLQKKNQIKQQGKNWVWVGA